MPTTYTYTILLHSLAVRRRMFDGFMVSTSGSKQKETKVRTHRSVDRCLVRSRPVARRRARELPELAQAAAAHVRHTEKPTEVLLVEALANVGVTLAIPASDHGRLSDLTPVAQPTQHCSAARSSERLHL